MFLDVFVFLSDASRWRKAWGLRQKAKAIKKKKKH